MDPTRINAVEGQLELLENLFAATRRARGIEMAFEPLPLLLPGGGFPPELLDLLSTAETAELSRLRIPKRRRDWLGGRLAAKAAALRLLQRAGLSLEPSEIEILKQDSGEPALRLSRPPRAASERIARPLEAPDVVEVTISHSGDLAAAAAWRRGSTGSIGLDIEQVRPVEPEIVPIALTSGEIRRIELAATEQERTRLILSLWTVKEAALKAAGVGLSVALQALEVVPGPECGNWTVRLDSRDGTHPTREFLVETSIAAGYVVSLAVSCTGASETHPR